ncbi:MAG: hypothetical protein ACKOWE_04615 [Micrococcales bacterium]
MPTFSLLEARYVADQLMAKGIPAEITQTSQHRFEVLSERKPAMPRVLERFQFNRGWALKPKNWVFMSLPIAGLLAFAIIAFAMLRPVRAIEVKRSPQAMVWVSDAEIAAECLAALVTEGKCSQGKNEFQEVKRIELGGYLNLLVNQSLDEQTRLIRLDLVKQSKGWKLEKWVQLD